MSRLLPLPPEAAAEANRAHPGDHSRIVPLVVSEHEFDRLFTSRGSLVADLRKIGGPVLAGDCNRNGRVAIDELIRGVNMALGSTPSASARRSTASRTDA